jgi:hypothetical protein
MTENREYPASGGSLRKNENYDRETSIESP